MKIRPIDIFGIFVSLFVLYTFIRPDSVIEAEMVKMNSHSPFTVNFIIPFANKNIPFNDTLGNFYQCLKNYKKIGLHRNPEGEYWILKLNVGNNILIRVVFYGVNAHYMQVFGLTNDDNSRSSSYSINCDLALLVDESSNYSDWLEQYRINLKR